MSESVKASRSVVTIGSLVVEGFMLPNGQYQMSLTSMADSVDLGVQNASDFLRSKTLKSLMGEGYTPQTFEIESEDQLRGQTRFRAVPLEIVRRYWLWQSTRGNKKAIELVLALSGQVNI